MFDCTLTGGRQIRLLRRLQICAQARHPAQPQTPAVGEAATPQSCRLGRLNRPRAARPYAEPSRLESESPSGRASRSRATPPRRCAAGRDRQARDPATTAEGSGAAKLLVGIPGRRSPRCPCRLILQRCWRSEPPTDQGTRCRHGPAPQCGPAPLRHRARAQPPERAARSREPGPG